MHILAVIEGSHKNLLFGSVAISTQKHLQMQKHLKKLIDNVCASNNIIPTMSVREGEIVEEITKEVKIFDDCKLMLQHQKEMKLTKKFSPLKDLSFHPVMVEMRGFKTISTHIEYVYNKYVSKIHS